jgi:peroxiredoxin
MHRLINRKYIALLILFTAISLTGFIAETDRVITDFSLKNTDGKIFSTVALKDTKGLIVIFTCNHCPFAKLYTKRMNELNKKYKALKVPLIAINSMDTLVYDDETFDLMKKKAHNERFNFPYLQDATQDVGKQFKAEHTPMAYVIWKENNNWIVKYRGTIDDNGEQPSKATPFIANAVDALLLNQKVAVPETETFGCRIFYRKK